MRKQHNHAQNMPSNEMLQSLIEAYFTLKDDEMTEEKMFAETDPERKKFLYEIYSSMIVS